MSQFPWGKLMLTSFGIMGAGYVIMRTTTPTPEQTYAAMSPELRKKVDANRAARLARENATKQQETAQLNDPDAQKPIWADAPRS
ncbi:hypothetical protein PYCCODRAFT_1435174 [Trametes coccinea BRFM310]|uniref:Assembly factor CBP4 n=1 Tax=Trametes coccinea (strain BRFM310) TaxID=1353009 RepID=A0A1Y2IRP7_TRAC3|nr:hypothetical protein PYCCODRAFT_1435174 [Trametes coccinea BRFM310]